MLRNGPEDFDVVGVAIFTTFLHCVCQMRLDAQSEEYFFRLSRLLHNCLIREQHHSGPSELSLLADHPEPSDD